MEGWGGRGRDTGGRLEGLGVGGGRGFLLGLLGEHWPSRRGHAGVAAGGGGRPGHQGAAALEQVRPQRLQVIAGPGALAEHSSVEILERRKL